MPTTQPRITTDGKPFVGTRFSLVAAIRNAEAKALDEAIRTALANVEARQDNEAAAMAAAEADGVNVEALVDGWGDCFEDDFLDEALANEVFDGIGDLRPEHRRPAAFLPGQDWDALMVANVF